MRLGKRSAKPQCNDTLLNLRESGLSAATINQGLCAIPKLAEEAADNGALDPQIANGVRAVKGIRQEGALG
jgi:hypothetical protein